MRRLVTRPAGLVLVPVVMSFVMWSIDWSPTVRRGFGVKQHLDVLAGSTLVGWYALIAGFGTIGWAIGRSTRPVLTLDSASDDQVYRILTWVGAVGVLGMYALVELRSPGLIAQSLGDQQFNLVRKQVPSAPGVATLRYATILSGAIALHRVIIQRERRRVHFLNVTMLILNVLVASRLALLMAILVFIGLTATRRARTVQRSRRTGRWIVLALLVLVVLGAANYGRNANFYRANYGTDNPVTMLASEVVAYAGSPFQVSVGTANALQASVNPSAGLGAITGAARLATPSFFVGPDPNITAHYNWYRGTVDIEPGLTTNSAFASEVGLLGMWAFPFAAATALIAGFLMGHMSRYRSYMALGSFVIGYCFAESWRIYLFGEGIVWFLVAVVWAACAWSSRGRAKHHQSASAISLTTHLDAAGA